MLTIKLITEQTERVIKGLEKKHFGNAVETINQVIELDKVRFKGYAFQIEMKFTSYKCGFKIKEVPVIFVNRELGTSKMNSSIFGEAVFGVMRLRWDGWFRKYPQKATK